MQNCIMQNCIKRKNYINLHAKTDIPQSPGDKLIKAIMIENPFIITEKVIPEYFCDREAETAELSKLLKNGNNVVLISRRRIGKTSLIQYCFGMEEIKENFFSVYVDILSTTNLREFTFLLGREIFDTLKSRGEKIWQSFLLTVKSLAGKIGFDPVSGLPSLNVQLGDINQPEYTLKEIFAYLSSADKPCIVAIDEFQQISKYPEKNVEALIRSHLLQINNCRMIFSGSERHILENMFLSASRPFYLSASFMELKKIPADYYVEFICRLFREKDKMISEELARKVYDMFDGITYYVQRVCNGLFANTGIHREASEELLSQTLDEIVYSFDTVFRLRLSQLTTRQKELLLALAAEKVVEKITSAEFIHKHSLTSSSSVQAALKSLVNNSLVAQDERGYFIEDYFFRYWLCRNF